LLDHYDVIESCSIGSLCLVITVIALSGRKIGIYIPRDLEEAIGKHIEKHGGRSISSLVQEALRSYLASQEIPECNLVGYIMILYRHGVGDIDRELTEIQHEYLGLILFENHIHIDEERCLSTIAVKGGYDQVESLLKKIRSLRGVLLVKHLCICL